jgi:hypothetical protein
MKGSLILAILSAVAALISVIALWPSSADVDRASSNLERQMNRIEQHLLSISSDVQEIAKRKPANKLKDEMVALRDRASGLRRDLKNLLAHYRSSEKPSTKTEALRTLQNLREEATQVEKDAVDVAVRTKAMRDFLEEIDPVRARVRKLRGTLARREEQTQDQDVIRRIRAAIDASSRAEDLAQVALERLSLKLEEGKIMAKTALNELMDAVNEMETLLGGS